MRPKLVFVYNADSGIFNTASDIAHKILSPKTYSCQLCALTHGYFSIREEWVGFLEELNTECDFLHRDEFMKQYGVSDVELPAVYLSQDNSLDIFLSAKEINKCENLALLKKALKEKLTTLQ